MKIPTECKECGSKNFSWQAGVHNTGGCTDGRIRMHEVSGRFILGCNDCSETLLIVDADKIAALMDRIMNLNRKGISVNLYET